MRRITKLGAAVAGLALVLAGCGSDDGTSDESSSPPVSGGNLLVWGDEFSGPAMQELCDQFAADAGVTCEVVVSDTVRESVVQANNTGDVPDIFTGAHDWLGELTGNGVIAPIDLGAKESSFAEAAVKAAKVEGQNFAVPFAQENVALLTNLDLVSGCPASLDEVEKNGMALVDEGKATLGLALQIGSTGDPYHWYPLFTADGGYIFGTNADGSYNPDDLGVDSEGGIAAAARLGQLAKDGLLSAEAAGDITQEAFNDGKAPYYITGPWNLTAAKDALGDSLVVCPVPNWEGSSYQSQPFTGVQLVYLTAKAKNPTIAQVFLTDYVMTTEFMDKMYELNPRPPAWIESAEKVADDPLMAGFVEYGMNGYPMPYIPEMAAVWGDMGIAEYKAASGEDPEDTMKTHAESIRKQF